MWQYFWPDMAIDFVKGLVAGGASLGVQAVAPGALRTLKRLRARWHARKAAHKIQSVTRERIEGRRWRWRRLRQ